MEKRLIDKIDITVFTPTYNRVDSLKILYYSLLNQQNASFEWLIVDDGSSDNTKEYIETLIIENQITIKYIYQENFGKMYAHNNGVSYARGRYFMCVDSDDFLVPNVLNKIIDQMENTGSTYPKNVCGIIAYRGSKDLRPLKKQHFPNISYATLLELLNRGFDADTTIIFYTNIIKNYPFPIIENEKFITEAYIYDQIGLKYKFKLLNEVVIICEYRNDGYSYNSNQLHIKYPLGWMKFYFQRISIEKHLKRKIINAINFNVHCIISSKIIKIFLNKYFYLTIPSLLFTYKRYKSIQKVG